MQHRDDTRRLFGFAGIDGFDLRVRMRTAQRFHVDLVGDVHVLDVVAETGHDAKTLGPNLRLADDLEVRGRQLRTRVGERRDLRVRRPVDRRVLRGDGAGYFGAANAERAQLLTVQDRRPLLRRQRARVGLVGCNPQHIHVDWHINQGSPTT